MICRSSGTLSDGLAAFLDVGADVNAETPDAHTARMEAARSMQFESATLLLAYGARENRVATDATTLEQLMARGPFLI